MIHAFQSMFSQSFMCHKLFCLHTCGFDPICYSGLAFGSVLRSYHTSVCDSFKAISAVAEGLCVSKLCFQVSGR